MLINGQDVENYKVVQHALNFTRYNGSSKIGRDNRKAILHGIIEMEGSISKDIGSVVLAENDISNRKTDEYLSMFFFVGLIYERQYKEIYFTEKFKEYVLKAESRPVNEDEDNETDNACAQ